MAPRLKAMSPEQFKAFLQAVKADPGLQEKLSAAGDAESIAALGEAMGFAIFADDIRDFQSALQELSEEELDGVAGGIQLPRGPAPF